MASRVVTLWECDRCEAKAEEKGNGIPKGWRSVSVSIRGGAAVVGGAEEHAAELCPTCSKNLIDAVTRQTRPAPTSTLHYPEGVR